MIIRGTTPTLTFHVKDETLDLTTLAALWITFKSKAGNPKQIEKTFTLEDVNVDAANHNIEVYMSQEDTLEFMTSNMEFQIRARFDNDKAYASPIKDDLIGRILKEGVI